jgi:Ca2+-binding RTX toxin-like protein
LDGKAGDDVLEGSGDWILAGRCNDIVFGENGMDSTDGGAGNDILFGGDNDDSITGDLTPILPPTAMIISQCRRCAQSRFPTGNGGNDMLIGSEGDDPGVNSVIGTFEFVDGTSALTALN